MPEFIMENPFHSRYKMIKVLEDSSLRCKMLIHRRKTLHRYVMIAVPTVTDRSGKSNGCKDFVAKLLKLSHPNIARVIEAFLHKDYCYYVFEDWYTTRKLRGLGFHTLSEPEIATTIRHVCSAIRYLHVNGIVHGSMSMNDLAFYDAHETKLDFMMIDLGVSRHVDVSQHQRLITKYPRKGNPPEAKLGQYTPGSDVWTVGAIAYHLLSHDSSPSPLIDREVPLETILKGFRQNKSISREARDFVVRCLRLDTTQRMDSRDLLDHVWFQKTSTRSQDHHRVHNMITSDQAYFQRTVRKFQDHAEKIRRHDRDSAFKRVANRFIAYHVPRNIQQDYRDLYARFDDDFLGTLSSDEFHGVLSEHIPNVQHLRQLFEYMDANQSGFIEYDEFLGHLVGYEENHESQVLMEAFHTLDVDNDGLITASDLSRRLDQDVVVCASMIDEVVPRLEGEGSQLNMYQFIELFKLFGRRELMLSMKNGLSNSFTSFSDSFRSLRNNLSAVRHKSTVGE